MKHHALTAATGLLIATVLVPTGHAQAASADPTGIWRKADQGERPGKIEVSRCGSGKRYLCAKIVWLQNPLDSKGRPLHDVRNENPSMRDRPILGLPIISGLAPSAPNVWKGSIYNPEDGNTYTATLTLVSRDRINLKGCKAWLFCGERTWLRTSLPKPEPEPQIEASAEPEAVVQPAAVEENPLANAEMLTPAVEQSARPGYRFLNTSSTAQTPVELSGENVPSMFVMTAPIASETADVAKDERTGAIPAPKPAPKPQAMQANAAATPKPHSAQAAPAAALPADPQAAGIETAETETAETAIAEEVPLTRRQRRLLRRQQQSGVLPWQN